MSDYSINVREFNNKTDFAFSSRPKVKNDTKSETKKDKVILAAKIFLFVALAFFAFEAFYFLLLKPSLSYPKVRFSGNSNYTSEELAEYLRPMNAKNLYSFDSSSAVSILTSISGIDSAVVLKNFPNEIVINIVEREAVAMTFLNQNGKSIPVEIDKNGVIFPDKKSRQTGMNIPIVSGLPVEHLSEGMRIPLKYRPLIEQISEIQKVSQKYFAAISEICVVPKEYGNYELILIPAIAKIKVLTDRSLNEDALKDMIVVLDVVKKMDSSVNEIDLRYGSISFRNR